MSSTVAASEAASCHERGYSTPVLYDLERVNSSLVAKQTPRKHGSDLAVEAPANNITPELPEKWGQDVGTSQTAERCRCAC